MPSSRAGLPVHNVKTEQSRCHQTVTTSINSKVCDMMVDYFLSKTFIEELHSSMSDYFFNDKDEEALQQYTKYHKLQPVIPTCTCLT